MEAIIDQANASGQKIDAILAENDSTALGVVAALTAKSYGFPPLSGQDGDPANLNNVALGKQYVDVWKNANELGKAAGQAALDLCAGTAMADLALPDGFINASVAPVAGSAVQDFTTPDGTVVKSFILQPTPITAETLDQVISAGWWATKDDICKGVTASDPGASACGL
jgi:D-xylose transport system substrate-binding protein